MKIISKVNELDVRLETIERILMIYNKYPEKAEAEPEPEKAEPEAEKKAEAKPEAKAEVEPEADAAEDKPKEESA